MVYRLVTGLEPLFKRLRMGSYTHSKVHKGAAHSSKPNKAPMTLMLAAASIKVMDALFGFLVRNDAECCKRELLGRRKRRD